MYVFIVVIRYIDIVYFLLLSLFEANIINICMYIMSKANICIRPSNISDGNFLILVARFFHNMMRGKFNAIRTQPT